VAAWVPSVSTLLPLLLASVAAFALAVVSAVAGFGGGVLALPLFTALFGLRVAVPVLTVTQLAGNTGRAWVNRHDLRWPLVGRFALGAIPMALVGGLLFTRAPLAPLQRLLGVLLLVVVVRRRRHRHPRPPRPATFVTVGAASGLGSALLGSVGPLTAPFFLAYGLTRGAYIGTEAAGALVLHLSKLVAYGAGDLVTTRVLELGAVLTPATVAGAYVGKHTLSHLSDQVFVRLVEAGLVLAGILLIVAP
jgi:uncharacterized protein